MVKQEVPSRWDIRCPEVLHMKAFGQGGFRLLATFAVLMALSGCGATEEELAAWEAEQAEQVDTVEQALTCDYCPGSMTGYRGQVGASLLCYCSGGATSAGSVYGTDIYTDDSSLCRAALHAGAVGTGGGFIVATMGSGSSTYPASTRNGVTSLAYGSYPYSYSVRTGSACTLACPLELTSYRGKNGTVVTCNCSSAATSSGSVWGTNTYTDDSTVCRAAVHAGRITTAGGIVRAVISPGLASYMASTRNGVTSSSWGGWYGSYYFQ